MIPNFNEFGLLPVGIYQTDLTEFEAKLGFNPKRREMIEKGLKPFLTELGRTAIREIYLDGSFVTIKNNPDDIDGYTITDSLSESAAFILENSERWHSEYRVDFNPAFKDLEGEMSQEWWKNFFSQDPESGNSKGFVVLKV